MALPFGICTADTRQRGNPVVLPVGLVVIGLILLYAGFNDLSVADVIGETFTGKKPQRGNSPSITTPLKGGTDSTGTPTGPLASAGDVLRGVTGGRLLHELAKVAKEQFHLDVHEFGPSLGQKFPESSGVVTQVHSAGSYHYRGRAFDASGSATNMAAFTLYILHFYTPRISELIHKPTGAIKDGRKVDGATVYSAQSGSGTVWDGHEDHVHVAI